MGHIVYPVLLVCDYISITQNLPRLKGMWQCMFLKAKDQEQSNFILKTSFNMALSEIRQIA